MRERQVRYAPRAERDLERISDWLADVTPDRTAVRFIRSIKKRIETLAYSAERGTVRDAKSNLRVIGVLPSISIAFVVEGDVVNVQRVIYGGQDWQTDLAAKSGD